MSAAPRAPDEHGRDPFRAVPWRAALAGILVITALVFLPVVGFPFVYDDHWTIVRNGFLRVPSDLPILLSPEATARGVVDAFRPVSVAFDVLTYQLFGLDPAVHHALSILAHLGVVALLARVLRRMGAEPAVSLTAAACFGVLAIHAEAIAVVSFREDVLAALCGLVAITLADIGVRTRGPAAFALHASAAACMALACGCKLSAAPLPAVFVLAHLLRPFGAPRPRAGSLVFATTWLGLGVGLVLAHRLLVIGAIDPYGVADPGVLMHRVGAGPVLAATLPIHLGYVQQIVAPWGLSPEYTDRAASFSDPAVLLAAAALGTGIAYTLWRARARPVLALAVIGTALLALPTSNLFPMPNMRADRFMYLPSLTACVGLGAALVLAGRRLAHVCMRPAFALGPAIAFVVLQGSFAQASAVPYKSDRRLWEIAIRRAPDSVRAHAVLGELAVLEWVDTGSRDDALRLRAEGHCRIAKRLDPGDPLAWLCEARLAAAMRERLRAYRSFARAYALSTARRDRVAAALAAAALDRTDRPFGTRAAEATALLDRAMREAPYSSPLVAAAAQMHHRLGAAETAADLYARASALDPERWDLVLRGVELALDLGHPSAAGRAFEAHADLLEQADPARRAAVRRRLARASRMWPSH